LEERMGVRVRAICGHCREERELKEGDLNDEELKIEKLIRETNEKEIHGVSAGNRRFDSIKYITSSHCKAWTT
jgi:hypothetical protein